MAGGLETTPEELSWLSPGGGVDGALKVVIVPTYFLTGENAVCDTTEQRKCCCGPGKDQDQKYLY